PTNCDAHLAESLFQTRSRVCQKIIPVILDKLWREFSRVYFTGNSA
ncbi:DUF6783 domain-containing protein, partial [Blautia glucerasea]